MKYKLNYNNDKQISINDMEDLIETIKKEKSKIDENPNKWSVIKKIINEYEYIYTSPNPNKNIALFYPYSRSYFKMKEILNKFNIIKNSNNIFCIAEAPGGFIQCLLEYNVTIDATSLLSEDKKIPYWNKKLIDKNINFKYGIKNNGDICDTNNLISLIKGKNNYYDIVTADGGFDYSNDFNKQEISSYKLLFSEIYIALNIQQEGGTFIIKVFDIFYHKTIQLLYLLFLSYEEVHIYKPTISRLSNSEKYIVCKGFKPFNKEIIDLLDKYFDNVNNLHIDIPLEFINKIKEYNNIFVNNQINYIKNILKFNVKNINERIKDQIQFSYDWCIKYRLPINKDCIYLR